MSIVLMCSLFVIIRAVESVGRLLISLIRRQFYTSKQYSYKRISAIVSPELHARIKAHVLLLNMTITDFILVAVSEKLQGGNYGK
jgi:hypothetical protein